jgi:hypothetical protein
MTQVMTDDDIDRVIVLAGHRWWKVMGKGTVTRDQLIAREAEARVIAALAERAGTIPELLTECRTALADMDRPCDRELIDRIDAAVTEWTK